MDAFQKRSSSFSHRTSLQKPRTGSKARSVSLRLPAGHRSRSTHSRSFRSSTRSTRGSDGGDNDKFECVRYSPILSGSKISLRSYQHEYSSYYRRKSRSSSNFSGISITPSDEVFVHIHEERYDTGKFNLLFDYWCAVLSFNTLICFQFLFPSVVFVPHVLRHTYAI